MSCNNKIIVLFHFDIKFVELMLIYKQNDGGRFGYWRFSFNTSRQGPTDCTMIINFLSSQSLKFLLTDKEIKKHKAKMKLLNSIFSNGRGCFKRHFLHSLFPSVYTQLMKLNLNLMNKTPSLIYLGNRWW